LGEQRLDSIVSPMRGRLIVMEGIDGSGLSTQSNLLVARLQDAGTRAFATKEPSTGPLGIVIREALSGRLPLGEDVLALLFAGDRLEHSAREITWRLREGIHVISDRYYLSSLAYQWVNLDLDWLKHINAKCIVPDLTVFLDVPVEVCMKRIAQRVISERYETSEMLKRVRQNYLALLKETTSSGCSVVSIDGTMPIPQVLSSLWSAVSQAISQEPGPLQTLGQSLQ